MKDLKSLLWVALAGAGLYFAMRRKAPGSGQLGKQGPRVPPPPRAEPGPAWCEDPDFDRNKTEVFLESFERAWDLFGYKRGQFENTTDAAQKSHDLALWVMADVCPQLPRPEQRMNVPSYARRYGAAWAGAYETPYGWAWSRLVAMPT